MKKVKDKDAYIAKDNNEVFCRKQVIARIYLKPDATKELRILQGMPRDATVTKLLSDCPEFCAHNGITSGTYPLLF